MAMRSDVFIGLALIALFGGYWAMADALPSSLMDTSVTSADTPKLIAVAGMGLSFLLILQALLNFRLRKASAPSSSENQADDGAMKGPHWRAFAMLAFGAGFVLLLPYLGYAVSLALLFAAVAGFRAGGLSWRIGAFAVITAIAFQLIFGELLNVRVPAGLLAPLLG
jgi:putative tricarboxylic transport membrane protein